MPRPLFDSPYLFGLHDPGGESVMAQAGRRGWILFTEAVGSDPNDTSGKDFTPWSNQDFGIICRINNGYGSVGTIPTSDRYADFARRVANFVAASPGCKIWVIGNEMNHSQEWPEATVATLRAAAAPSAPLPMGPTADPFGHGSKSRFGALYAAAPASVPEANVRTASVEAAAIRAGFQTITPNLYIDCYRRCRTAIRALPGHADDLVVIGAVAPWNVETRYPGNENGDWVKYFLDILTPLGADGCDGIALHTYTHGSDPALVTATSKMNPPFQDRYFHFLAYRDFMQAIPANMRSLPIFITETDQDVPWLDQNNGWVKAAYAEINRWNTQPGRQQIRCLLLYRWQPFDRWAIQGKNGVIQDFREAMQNNYRWKEPPPKPAAYQVGDVVRTLSTVNLRAAPAGQVLAQVPTGTDLTIRDARFVMVSGLPYWPVRGLVNGQARDGWVAQYTMDGVILLAPAPLPASPRPARYQPGDQLITLDILNFRAQPLGQILGQLPADTVVTVRDPIFVMAGGLPYWSVRAPLDGQSRDGWLAQYTSTGQPLLAPYEPVSPPAVEPSGAFQPGDAVRTLTAVRMRRSPGVTGKPADDTVAIVPQGSVLTVLGGPEKADNMTWWRVKGNLPDGQRVEGWMAEALPDGEQLLDKTGIEAPPGIGVPLPARTFQTGDRFQTLTLVRLRRSPGVTAKPADDIITEVQGGSEGNIQGGPGEADGMIWWQVQVAGGTGGLLRGWMAEALPDGERLMQKIAGGTPIPGFARGDLIQTTDYVNVRRSPGIHNKPADDVFGALQPRAILVILGGPEASDGLTWWRIGGILVPGGEVKGWVAERTPDGIPLLAKPARLPGTNIPDKVTGTYLKAPFSGTYGISQLWGENPSFYSQYSYDGVPLLGHNGIDFLTPSGTVIVAVEDGEVIQSGFEQGGFGNFVLLRHSWGESIYAHLSTIGVAKGQAVGRGQYIGLSGNSGGSTGPHLHFAIRTNPYSRTDGWGGYSDPLPYLPVDAYVLPPYVLDPGVLSIAAALPAPGAAARQDPPAMGNVPGELRP